MALFAKTHGPWWLTGGAHATILVIAVQAETSAAWPYALFAMSVVSFVAWLGNHRRYRLIHDLPTSKIFSAAQGYVELVGHSDVIDGTPVLSRFAQLPCCWYAYKVEEEKADNKWEVVDQGTSNAHFLLVDDSGACVISPEGAEVVTKNHRNWREGHYRYSEWLLLPKSTLYAIGEFVTSSGNVHQRAEEQAQIRELIAEWKDDRETLHRRFDLDQDGTISAQEWELARLQAAREVRQQLSQQAAKIVEGLHLLRKPRDRRLFLLANELPEQLGRRYRWWSWAHLIAFFGCGIWGLVLLGIK